MAMDFAWMACDWVEYLKCVIIWLIKLLFRQSGEFESMNFKCYASYLLHSITSKLVRSFHPSYFRINFKLTFRAMVLLLTEIEYHCKISTEPTHYRETKMLQQIFIFIIGLYCQIQFHKGISDEVNILFALHVSALSILFWLNGWSPKNMAKFTKFSSQSRSRFYQESWWGSVHI